MREWFRKHFDRMAHASASWFFSLLPRTRFDYQREVGRGDGSSVVMAPVKFIQRVFPEAPLRVRRRSQTDKILEDHAMVRLIEKPNRFYSGNALWRATIAAYIADGNAFWLKIRNSFFSPVELWWVPPWLMTPKWPEDGSEFISHYEYRPASFPVDVPVSEVVHIRNGLDPRNPRLGMSDLHAVLREIFSDDEASNFTAAILKNSGVPGVIISPKEGTVDEKEARAAETRFDQRVGGDRRGSVLAMRGPTDVKQFAWSPAQLELGSLRDVSEERVCAILGIPAAVVGFGAGLQQTKVGATMRELIKLAWISGIGPMQHAMAADIKSQLLPDFTARPERMDVFFDEAMVDALQENELERTKRMVMAWKGGLAKRSEGRSALRWSVGPEDDIYINEITKPVPAGGGSER